MFKIEKKKLGPLTLVKLVNKETGDFFSFIPEFGAAINDLVIHQKGKPLKLINSSKDYEDLVKNGSKMFKGCKLFPFPNRIKDGRYIWRGKKYQLPINFPSENHAIHGLVLGIKFEVATNKCSKNEASTELAYSYHSEMPGYPFKYWLQIIFSFSKTNGIKCQTIVKNEDKIAIPIGDGWHPYFQTGTTVDRLFLKIPSCQIVEVDKNMIPTGKIIISNKSSRMAKIGKSKFDNCYKITKAKDGIAETEIYDPEKNIRLIIWQEVGQNKYNYLQIYTPPSRNCIAVEPMTCPPDVFNNKRGLIIIKPQERYQASFGIKIK